MRRLAYYALLAAVFLMPTPITRVGGATVSFRVVAGLAAAGLWAISICSRGRMRRPDLLLVAASAFVGWSAVSSLWSLDANMSLISILVLGPCLALVFLTRDLVRTRRDFDGVLQAYIYGCMVSIAASLFAFASGSTTRVSAEGAQRFSAPNLDPNYLGLMLCLGMPMAWHLFRREHTGHPFLRWLHGAYWILAILALLLTRSRGALLAAVPALLWMLLSLRGLGRWQRVSSLLLLGGGIWALRFVDVSDTWRRFGSTLSSGDTMSGRLVIWRQALQAFLEHPIVGVGSGALQSYTETHIGRGVVAHNTYLSVAAELGLIGLLLLGVALCYATIAAIRQPPPYRGLSLALLCVWAIGVTSLTWENQPQTWLILVLATVSTRSAVAGDTRDRLGRSPGAGPSRGRLHERRAAVS